MNIATENTFTAPKFVPSGSGFDLTIGGSFTGDITVEFSKDGTTNWIAADVQSNEGVFSGRPSRDWYVRAGFRTGDYTSGSAEIEVL